MIELLLIIALIVILFGKRSTPVGQGHQPNVPPRDWTKVKPPSVGSAGRKDIS